MKKTKKQRKRSFIELVNENKRQLLQDQDAMKKIEQRIENRYLSNAY